INSSTSGGNNPGRAGGGGGASGGRAGWGSRGGGGTSARTAIPAAPTSKATRPIAAARDQRCGQWWRTRETDRSNMANLRKRSDGGSAAGSGPCSTLPVDLSRLPASCQGHGEKSAGHPESGFSRATRNGRKYNQI